MTSARQPREEATETFERERPRLCRLAYRMTGTPDDADDVVQDAWLRWQRADQSDIDNPAAWLTTVTTRLAIDRLTSARARREAYVGPWVPEPMVEGAPSAGEPSAGLSVDPSEVVAAADSLSLGFLRVLETLTPVERAVFLLHDVFGYTFDEVASVVDRSPAAARQTARRARQRVRDGRPRIEPDPPDVESLLDAFFAAVLDGKVEALTAMLTADTVHVSDGGAERHAARRVIVGADKVARLFVNIARRELKSTDEIHRVTVNGHAGVYILRDGEPFLLLTLGWQDGLLAETVAILNPDKLARFHQRWSRDRWPRPG